jgi:hypothetical protein
MRSKAPNQLNEFAILFFVNYGAMKRIERLFDNEDLEY